MSKRPRPVTNPTQSRFREGPIRFRNETGSTISRGDLVYASGFDAASGLVNVVLADADALGRAAEWVVLTGSVLNNGIGVAGKRERLTGLNTSAATTGDPVYLSATAGAWTLTDPTDADPNGLAQIVGFVDVVNATTGVVEFRIPEGVDQIGTNEIQDSAVTSAKIAASTIVDADIAAAAAIARSKLAQDDLAVFRIPLENFRVFDAYQTVLPGTAAADDMALVGGTHATAAPMLEGVTATGSATETQKARVTFNLPAEYVAGETLTLRVRCRTSGGQGEGTKTIDAEVVSNDEDGTVSADLVTTGAITVDDTFTDRDFTITPTGLAAGEQLDMLLTSVIEDAGVDGKFQAAFVAVLCDIKG